MWHLRPRLKNQASHPQTPIPFVVRYFLTFRLTFLCLFYKVPMTSVFEWLRASKKHFIKATYYIDPALVKRLKILGVEEDRDLSDLVNEAIGDLVGKREAKRWQVV